ncbi:MAG: hypothetical protein V4457_08295 [Pseudomonadota bacterium]
MRQERFDLGRAHIARVSPDGEDKPTHPIDVGIVGVDAVIQRADTGAHFIQHGIGLAAAPEV